MEDTHEYEKERKKKKPAVPYAFTRCREPWCYETINIYRDQDPDVELARHQYRKHQIPLPEWAQDEDFKNWKFKKR